MIPIQQMIISLQPKKKLPLIEWIPDFESYNDDNNINNDDIQSSSSIEVYDNNIQESLSERLYKEIDGKTTRIYFLFNLVFLSIKYFYLFYSGRSTVTTPTTTTTTKEYPEQKDTSNGQLITYSMTLYLTIFIIHQMKKI